MKQEEHHCQKESLKVSRNSEDVLDNLSVAISSMELLFRLDLIDRLLVFDLDIGMVGRKVSKRAKVLKTKLSFTDSDEISRSFEQERDLDQHEECRGERDSNRRLPLRGTVVRPK